MKGIRINKYIAASGICSRRMAEKYIQEGSVLVNGKVVKELATQIYDKDRVELNGNVIGLETKKIYIMLNKPKGYITTAKEQFGRSSVIDLIDVKQRIYPVGRLDMDSEGLLLLTNDGDFTNNIIHPTKHITKQYEVRLKENISDSEIKMLEKGVDIGGYVTRPAAVERITNNEILITISEGKNRQVRRMCKCVNNKVMNLKRIAIGKLKLGNLAEGQYTVLNSEDINKIFE